MKLPYLYKDWPEDGLQGREQAHWKIRNKMNLKQKSYLKKKKDLINKLDINNRSREEEILKLKRIFKSFTMNFK